MESNNKLSLTGLKEITLFLKIGALGLRDGIFTEARAKGILDISEQKFIFSKADMAEYLTEDKRDRVCYRFIEKLIEIGVLRKVKLYKGNGNNYEVNPETYIEQLHLLTEKDELFRHAKTIFGERGL